MTDTNFQLVPTGKRNADSKWSPSPRKTTSEIINQLLRTPLIRLDQLGLEVLRAVRHALEKDGWTITADPYTLSWGKDSLFVDLAAERFIAAEKENEKIAVEIKSFVGRSQTAELEQALGQFSLYYSVMQRTETDRSLYLCRAGHGLL